MNLIIFLDSLCKITKNRKWSTGHYFHSTVSEVPHASDCCRLCQEDTICVGSSYSMGKDMNCIFHWPNGDQPLSMSANYPDWMALETTGCACGKGYCCMDMSSANKYFYHWIFILIFVLSCDFYARLL